MEGKLGNPLRKESDSLPHSATTPKRGGITISLFFYHTNTHYLPAMWENTEREREYIIPSGGLPPLPPTPTLPFIAPFFFPSLKWEERGWEEKRAFVEFSEDGRRAACFNVCLRRKGGRIFQIYLHPRTALYRGVQCEGERFICRREGERGRDLSGMALPPSPLFLSPFYAAYRGLYAGAREQAPRYLPLLSKNDEFVHTLCLSFYLVLNIVTERTLLKILKTTEQDNNIAMHMAPFRTLRIRGK